MQVAAKFRKGEWWVDTRAKSIKKVNGVTGEQKRFGIDRVAADAYANFVNKAQESGGAVTISTAGTVDALFGEFFEKLDRRVRKGSIVYKHSENQKTHLRRFGQSIVRNDVRFGELKCVDVTVNDIEELIDGMTQAYKTQKEHLRSLKIALDFAKQLGWAAWKKEDNPARNFRHENNKHLVTVDEVENKSDGIDRIDLDIVAQLVQNAMRYDKPLFSQKGDIICPAWCDGLALVTAITTGVSFGEHSALKWKYLDFNSAEIKVYGANRLVGKNQIGFGYGKADARRRVIPIGPTVLQALREWKARSPKSDPDDYIFITREGRPQISSDNWRNRVLMQCGEGVIEDCPHIRWHDLRHIYASILVEEHKPDRSIENGWTEIARLMGHKNIKTTFNYYVHWILNAEKNKQVGSAIERRVRLEHAKIV